MNKQKTGKLMYKRNGNIAKTRRNSYNENEHWKVATAHKKRKIIPGIGAIKISDTAKQQWLQDIPPRNSFSSLIEAVDTDPKQKATTHIVKPSPIYIYGQIIDPLIERLNNIAGKENFGIKQLKLGQVKVQTKTPEIVRNVTQALQEKNAGYHIY